jgi:YVTN family beta-propeller protein
MFKTKLISCSVPSPLERVRERCFVLVLGVGLFLTSCDDMDDKLKPEINTGAAEPTQLYILSEGLFNMNNSTLASYDLNSKTLVSDFFLTVNKRGLGDTANDMGIYGSKMYVVVNVSSQIEVLDVKSGKSLAQIAMKNEKGIAREPRYIEFYAGKAYVCSFDGTVAKIDTSTLKIETFVQCGKNPDGICVANNKLYVSNSGGLSFPDYDNTVSVIDINTFTEIKKITVATNPGKIHADSEGDVYVVSRGDYGANPYLFQRINSKTDTLEDTFEDIQALNFNIHNDTAYIYNFDFTNQTCWVKVFDCKTEKIISENFITDGTELSTPYGVDINPANGDVYLTDAKSYTVWGDVLCFDRHGKLKFKINEIGLNPNKVVFASP